jgi:hypothetical protein
VPRLRDRSTGDILVLAVTLTICGSVLLGGAAIVAVELFHPETDTAAGARTIAGIINTMVGLLAGYLAGRTGSTLAEKDDR